MLSNFHLTALMPQDGKSQLLHIPLHQTLQDLLAETWDHQLNEFINDVEEINFNVSYKPEDHERFRLSPFDLPEPLHGINSSNIKNFEPISQHEEMITSIQAIVAFCKDSKGKEIVLFQNFSRSHIIQPGRFLLLTNNTYESAKRPGLSLSGKLSAVYSPGDKKLVFHNFRVTNTFLPLSEFYKEASDEEIRQILNHQLIAAKEVETHITGANQWFRKRFAMLADSGILDKYSAQQIRNRSKGYDVDIHIEKGKIVFPEEKTSAKKLLQFLNEELYRGAITDTLYETNSKREAD